MPAYSRFDMLLRFGGDQLLCWLHKCAIIVAFRAGAALSDLCYAVSYERIPKLMNVPIKQLSLLLLYVACYHFTERK